MVPGSKEPKAASAASEKGALPRKVNEPFFALPIGGPSHSSPKKMEAVPPVRDTQRAAWGFMPVEHNRPCHTGGRFRGDDLILTFRKRMKRCREC